MKEIPVFIERKSVNHTDSKIPRNLIQTYKHNMLHDFIYENIQKILETNSDYNYYLITDEIGIDLIKQHFDQRTLDAYNRLNLGAAKGDFLRYVAMYVYGGIYLDLDSSINTHLSSFIDPTIEHLFFLDGGCNLQQWCFASAPKNPILLKIIEEMIRRIDNNEENIFLATGPTLFTDVVYNLIQNSQHYNTTLYIPWSERFKTFMANTTCNNGVILFEHDETLDFHNKFHNTLEGYNHDMLYNNDRYIPTWNCPTPNFYK
uniref:Glycosyltransferase n=1 Tax=viral metagenome TaxID=1070528 RepID=A0A6C0LHC6_9ZZZZ